MSSLILPPQPNGIAGASTFGWVSKLGWAGGKSKQEGTALWVRNKIDDDLLAATLRSLSQQRSNLSVVIVVFLPNDISSTPSVLPDFSSQRDTKKLCGHKTVTEKNQTLKNQGRQIKC